MWNKGTKRGQIVDKKTAALKEHQHGGIFCMECADAGDQSFASSLNSPLFA